VTGKVKKLTGRYYETTQQESVLLFNCGGARHFFTAETQKNAEGRKEKKFSLGSETRKRLIEKRKSKGFVRCESPRLCGEI